GRNPRSTDLNERHPFDVEILRIPAGKIPYPFHSHSAQWEFYHVISGTGEVRHAEDTTPIETGDAFLFKPGEPPSTHQHKRSGHGHLRHRGQSDRRECLLSRQQEMGDPVTRAASASW